jgi:hypothetical protein
MLIILLDEPGLFVFPSPSAAVREIEPIDAETQIRAAFDEAGVLYRVNWLRPNRRRTALFGLLKSIDQGEYELLPAGPAQPATLRKLLEAHLTYTHPPDAKTDLEALLAKLRAV